jgi:hypothetical protein
MSNAAIYVRVSTAGQEQDGTSLRTQGNACRAHATDRGYVVDEAHVYRDTHTSTELWERPQLTRLREAIRRREVDCRICYAIDRLARDPVHLGVILTEAEHTGIDFSSSVSRWTTPRRVNSSASSAVTRPRSSTRRSGSGRSAAVMPASRRASCCQAVGHCTATASSPTGLPMSWTH